MTSPPIADFVLAERIKVSIWLVKEPSNHRDQESLSIKKTRIVVEWPSQPVDRMISLSPIIYIPFIIGTGMVFPLFDSFSDFLTIYVIGLSNGSNGHSLYFP